MKGVSSETYILSGEEFLVLAAACGMTAVTGFVNNGQITQEQTIEALHELIKKGALVEQGGKYSVDRAAAAMMRVAASAGKTLFVWPGNNLRPAMNCYFSDTAVTIVAPYEFKEKTFRLYSVAKAAFTDELETAGALPPKRGDALPLPPNLAEEDTAAISASPLLNLGNSMDSGAVDENVETVFEVFASGTETILRRLVVFRAGPAFGCADVTESGFEFFAGTRNMIAGWLKENVR